MTLASHTRPPTTRRWLGANRFVAHQGSPTLTATTGNGYGPYWLLDQTTPEGVTCQDIQEIDWLTYNIFGLFTTTAAAPSPNGVVVGMGYRNVRVESGATLTTAATTVSVTSAVPTQNLLVQIAGPTGATAYHDKATTFVVFRTAGDGADDLGSDLAFLGMWLVKAT